MKETSESVRQERQAALKRSRTAAYNFYVRSIKS